MKPLSIRLANWTDSDIAGYQLGVVLGLFPEWPEGEAWGEYKWVFWSQNPLGDELYNMLMQLVSLGVLEQNEDSFRWVGANKLLERKI